MWVPYCRFWLLTWNVIVATDTWEHKHHQHRVLIDSECHLVNRSTKAPLGDSIDVELHHCFNPRYHKGYFSITVPSDAHRKIPEPSAVHFVGRVVGPVIHMLWFPFVESKNAWIGKYELNYPGIYSANIEVRFVNFSLSSPVTENRIFADNNEIISSNYSFEMLDPHSVPYEAARHHHGYDSLCDGQTFVQGGYWKNMRENILPAKWTIDGIPNHVESISHQIKLAIELNTDNRFQYEPKHCSLIPLDQDSIRRCMSRKVSVQNPICLVGDSQSRHNTYMLIDLLKLNSSQYDELVSRTNVTDKHSPSDFGSSEFVYFERLFGVFDILTHKILSQCSYIFLSFGQWDVSNVDTIRREIPGYSVYSYAKRVRTALETIIANGVRRESIIWIGTYSYGGASRIYGNVPENRRRFDYRNDVTLHAMNVEALRVCTEILPASQCMDVSDMGSAVRDLAYDGGHYMGPVGTYISLASLSIICALDNRTAAMVDQTIDSIADPVSYTPSVYSYFRIFVYTVLAPIIILVIAALTFVVKHYRSLLIKARSAPTFSQISDHNERNLS